MNMKNKLSAILLSLLATIGLAACSQRQAATSPSSTQAGSRNLILATTTSTQDSGLLDVLIPEFEKTSGFTVKTVAVGSGQALKMGEECNADVLLVHSPAAEKGLMQHGFGKERWLVMHNDFIIVGPRDDPAGVKGKRDAAEAFKAIASTGSLFVSRGDDSGTYKMELSLWKAAGVTPGGKWYQESGQGMGATLKLASEKGGYTLSDRGTFLAYLQELELEKLVEGDKRLLNVYHVITVNPEKCPQSNYEGAIAFAKFLTTSETQKIIGQFGLEQYGQPLFYPDAEKSDAELGLP